MTDRELFEKALEALESSLYPQQKQLQTITALRERLAQPEHEFIKHHGDDEGWSEWVCPDPKGYLMKCCDCGLVHEAEFGVVRYKSETEREDCDRVDDPNLQAVFRMRRSEQWSPEDTAHRAGGMPMAQPEQCKYPDCKCATENPCLKGLAQPQMQPCAGRNCGSTNPNLHSAECFEDYEKATGLAQPVAWEDVLGAIARGWAHDDNKHKTMDVQLAVAIAKEIQDMVIAPPQRKPLTDGEIEVLAKKHNGIYYDCDITFARAIEAAHGIKENT